MKNFNRSDLPDMYSKLLWPNPDMDYVLRQNIVEYDMQSASLSVSRRFHLIGDEILDRLELMPKDKRTKQVGLMQRDDKVFSEKLIDAILQTRKEFLECNQLDEKNIVTLHSDAVIFVQKHPIKDSIDGVPFVKKNAWSSYIRYGRVEMFYDNGVITYKGIPKQMLQQHTLGINQYLLTVFEKLEEYDDRLFPYLRKFQRQYLQDKLPEYFYIPFGNTGKFKTENLKLLSYIARITMQEMR